MSNSEALHYGSAPHSTRRQARAHAKRERRRVWPWIVLAVVVLIVAIVAWVGVRALLAKNELEKVQTLASQLQKQAGAADTAALSKTGRELTKHAVEARGLTSDIIWRGVELVPGLGPNLAAVRQLSAVAADIGENAVDPLATVAGSVELADFKPVDGAVNLAPLVEARPSVSKANGTLTRAVADVKRIDTDGTLDVVRKAVDQVGDVLQKTHGMTDALDGAVQLAPAMLGADGPRNYLLLFQNNAELRSGGGIPGAVALIHAENGRISLVQQASSSDFPHYDEPVLPLPEGTRALYGDIVGTYIQNVTMTPDFRLSGQLAREMWKREYGTEVDGVISFDPVALAYMLKATGPIALPTGDTLTTDNAVPLLLNEVYKRYPRNTEQDLFFAAAASAVFNAVSGGELDPKALIDQLARAGNEDRFVMWSAHEAEQNIIARTTLAGIPPQSTSDEERFGIYLNDGTGSKMDYYLDVKYGVGQTVCRKDARPTYAIDVTLTNTAPVDAATSLPDYITGGGWFGVAPGEIRTLIGVYGPKPSIFMKAISGSDEFGVQTYVDLEHPVAQGQVQLKPGESRTVRFLYLGGAPFDGSVVADVTPGIVNHPVGRVAVTCGELGL